jgi:hypothetical protein
MRCSATAVAALLPLLSSVLAAQEQTVAIKDAPTAVIQNVTARFPNARVAGVSRETEEGKQVYEVTLKQDGKNIDVTTTPAGQLTLIEREIARRDLPASVSKLINSQYPRATYKMVESVTGVAGPTETLSFYEVLLVDAKKQTLELQVAPDGTAILKVEKKKKGEPD